MVAGEPSTVTQLAVSRKSCLVQSQMQPAWLQLHETSGFKKLTRPIPNATSSVAKVSGFMPPQLVAFEIEGVNFGYCFLAWWRYLCHILVPGLGEREEVHDTIYKYDNGDWLEMPQKLSVARFDITAVIVSEGKYPICPKWTPLLRLIKFTSLITALLLHYLSEVWIFLDFVYPSPLLSAIICCSHTSSLWSDVQFWLISPRKSHKSLISKTSDLLDWPAGRIYYLLMILGGNHPTESEGSVWPKRNLW